MFTSDHYKRLAVQAAVEKNRLIDEQLFEKAADHRKAEKYYLSRASRRLHVETGKPVNPDDSAKLRHSSMRYAVGIDIGHFPHVTTVGFGKMDTIWASPDCRHFHPTTRLSPKTMRRISRGLERFAMKEDVVP